MMSAFDAFFDWFTPVTIVASIISSAYPVYTYAKYPTYGGYCCTRIFWWVVGGLYVGGIGDMVNPSRQERLPTVCILFQYLIFVGLGIHFVGLVLWTLMYHKLYNHMKNGSYEKYYEGVVRRQGSAKLKELEEKSLGVCEDTHQAVEKPSMSRFGIVHLSIVYYFAVLTLCVARLVRAS